MANERVDKAWTKKGLDSYGNEAILATLAHYGVQVDEAGFKALAAERFPLQIALEWSNGWKGTGQFAGFPLAAADTLWARWLPDRAAPVTVSRKLIEVLEAHAAFRGGNQDAPVEAKQAEMEGLLRQAPLRDGKVDMAFSEEVLTRLPPEALKLFDELGEALAREGHPEKADAFARLEELLIPEREGVATAVVQAVRGDVEGAKSRLAALADDASSTSERRLMGIDALIHIGAREEAETRAAAMFDAAEKANDFHFGLDLAGRLEHLYTKRRAEREMADLLNRAHKLHDAHAKAHPHHEH